MEKIVKQTLLPTQKENKETDPNSLLIDIAKEKHIDKKWTDKPFFIIKILANTSKGDLAEEFIVRYCKQLGFTLEDKATRLGDYDKVINGKRFEIKMATEDVSGNFQFNHLRYDYKYDGVICIGVSPDSILFDIYSKGDLATGKAGTLVSMGRGQNSSFKLTKSKASLKPINRFKNSLADFIK